MHVVSGCKSMEISPDALCTVYVIEHTRASIIAYNRPVILARPVCIWTYARMLHVAVDRGAGRELEAPGHDRAVAVS